MPRSTRSPAWSPGGSSTSPCSTPWTPGWAGRPWCSYVDGFKQVNDGHGHLTGDDALVHLAAVLRASIRTTDSFLGRIGGDELAVVLPGCSVETAAARAEDLVAAVRGAPLQLGDGSTLALSVSVGVSQAPQHAADLRAIYAAADSALYDAKRAGRDRVAIGPPVGP